MRTGIIGCGKIASFHLNTIKGLSGVEVVGVADASSENLKSFSNKYNIANTYSSLDELLKQTKPNVIHILTPPKTHRDLAITAMNRGCHVYVEKPMATNSKEANEMIKASEKNNVKLCIGHNLLFEPVVRQAQEIVESFEFGDLVHLDVFFIFDTTRVADRAPSDKNFSKHWVHSLKGGLLQDLAPHPLSLGLHFIPDITEIYTIAKKVNTNGGLVNDELRVMIDSADSTAIISMSFRAQPDNILLNLYGTKMTVKVDVSNMLLVKQKLFKLPKKVSRGLDNLSQSLQISTQTIGNVLRFATGGVKDAGGMGVIIREFYKSIENNTLPPVIGREAAKVVELMNKIWN